MLKMNKYRVHFVDVGIAKIVNAITGDIAVFKAEAMLSGFKLGNKVSVTRVAL